MRRLIIVISAIILLIIGVVFCINNYKIAEVVEQKPVTLSVKIKSVNGQLIDVRETTEYTEGHADGAINIPLGDILKADFSKIDKDKPIFVYCRSGKRAEQARAMLEQAGYKNITNIGGLVNWENQGDKVCSSSAPSCS